MTRAAVVAATVVLAVHAAGHRTEGAPQEKGRPTFLESLEVNVVNVEVFVTDKKGNPITGLTAKDFEVSEDGKKVKLTNFLALGDEAAPVSQTSAYRTEAGRAGTRPGSGHVVLFVDNLAIHPGNRKRLLTEVRRLVDEGLVTGSQVMVASYDGYLRVLQPFTRDPALLLAAIADLEVLSPLAIARQADRSAVLRQGLRTLQSIRGVIGSDTRGTEAARYLRNYSREIDAHANMLRQQTAAAYYALSHLVNALGALPGRKALVYVSDGLPMRPGEELYYAVAEVTRHEMPDLSAVDSTEARDASLAVRSAGLDALGDMAGGRRGSRRGSNSAPDDLQTLASLANASQVSFYTIKPQGEIGGMPPELAGEAAALYTPQLRSIRENNLGDTLRVMASETGGVAVVGSDIEGLFGRVEEDFSSYYSLGYSPKHSGDGRLHKIKVKVKMRGVRARYRTSYIDKPVEAKLADSTSAALLLELDDNPLGISLAALKALSAEKKGEWIVPVAVTIPLDGVTLVQQGAVFACDAQLYVAARDAEGKTAPVQGMMLRIEVPSLEAARGQSYTARFNLKLREGAQRVAVGLVEPIAGTASFVGQDLDVGG